MFTGGRGVGLTRVDKVDMPILAYGHSASYTYNVNVLGNTGQHAANTSYRRNNGTSRGTSLLDRATVKDVISPCLWGFK